MFKVDVISTFLRNKKNLDKMIVSIFTFHLSVPFYNYHDTAAPFFSIYIEV